ncbi:MAG TPA: hypothetical protein VKF42_12350 [Chitinivibrionales bacterium]|jgi:hypothetical protein|nr:hypothetical protein [Chitinivibrionales bacterium]
MMNRTALLVCSLVACAFPQKYADFIILSSPRSFTILNQFQQPVSEQEKALFAENAPILVENENEVMGDQITRALRFVFDGKTWFLQKDEAGNLVGDKGKQSRQSYRKCGVLGDTVQITEDRAVSFSQQYPPAGRGAFLAKGETLVRIFSYGGSFYVKRGGTRPEYAWSTLAPKSAWKRLEHATEKPQGLTGYLSDMIVRRFTEANTAYREYFGHFNALTHQEKAVPAWHCEAHGGEIRCTLNLPYRNTSQLDESTQYLVRDVENMLIGKQCEVVAGKGEILVRPKAGSGAAP